MNFSSIINLKLDNNNPRCSGVPSAIFLAPTFETKVLDYMKNNYERIFPIIWANLGIPLYYLPESIMNGHLHDCLLYNNPSFNFSASSFLQVNDNFSSLIKKSNNIDIDSCGIALMDYNNPTLIVDYFLIDPDKDISNQLNEWMKYLLGKIWFKSKSSGNPMMCQGEVKKEDDDIFVTIPQLAQIHLSLDFTPRSSDDNFDEEGYQLANEIKEKINILKERGFMKLLVEIMDEIQDGLVTVSRIRITRDYRIFLSDWGEREVIMSPLPKTIFLLFLNHPEGILFKELIDYKDEIRTIYKNITLRENIDDIENSIDALIDPMNNSINEKCSRIRAAFLEVIAPHLALSYYISGKRAEPKKIVIDRNLVIIEN